MDENSSRIIEDAKFGRALAVHRRLRFPKDANVKDQWGRTPLDYAVAKNHPEVARVLHMGGAQLDGISLKSHGLHHPGRGDTIKFLVGEMGMDPNPKAGMFEEGCVDFLNFRAWCEGGWERGVEADLRSPPWCPDGPQAEDWFAKHGLPRA